MKHRLNIAVMILTFMVTGLVFSGCAPEGPVEEETDYFQFDTAILETDRGDITIRLEKEKAAEHSRNFLELCGSGYYNNTFFHRVVPGLLVQGGDPNTLDDDPANDGMGGSSYRGPDTLLAAEANDLKHTRGAVSMVRGNGPDTAGSQFFVVLSDVPEYDGEFTVFGRVESGLEILVEAAEQPGTPLKEGGFRPEKPLFITGSRLE